MYTLPPHPHCFHCHRINTWQTCTHTPPSSSLLPLLLGVYDIYGGWKVATFGKDLDSNLDFLIYWSLGLRPNCFISLGSPKSCAQFPTLLQPSHNTAATGWELHSLKPLTGHRGNTTGAWQLPPGAGSSAVASQSNQPRLVQVSKGKKKNPEHNLDPPTNGPSASSPGRSQDSCFRSSKDYNFQHALRGQSFPMDDYKSRHAIRLTTNSDNCMGGPRCTPGIVVQ